MIQKPSAFLEVRVHDATIKPSLVGLCVGYERNNWRSSQFASHILEWIPDFALKYSELNGLDSGNGVRLLREAAKRVYESEKFKNRGEFGELFLHAAIRQVFNSQPAISKIYYKSSINETVKGFDAVHVVGPPDDLELWLGEAKFYSDIEAAINAVIPELAKHTETDYLRDEFLLIKGKIDSSWPHAAALESLLSANKSLDEIFKRACLAVLITYDSDCIRAFSSCSKEYVEAFEAELRAHRETFASKELPQELIVHLILLPLDSKEKLVQELDNRLKALQNI